MTCYIVYTITCFAGLAMFMWMLYDLGDFKKSIRPEVWVFISTIISVLVLAGIRFLKEHFGTL